MTQFLIPPSGACRGCFPARNQTFGRREESRGWRSLELGWKRTVHKTFTLLCAALCVCVANNLGMICNGILGSREYPLEMFFWPKRFFLEPRESPGAATIPLRGGSKATRNSRSSITAFFAKVQPSFLSAPLWLGLGTTQLLRQGFSIAVMGELAPSTSW